MATVNTTTANTFEEWRVDTNLIGTAVGNLTNLTEVLTRGTDVIGALTDISTNLATAETTIAAIPATYVDVAGDTMTGDLNFNDNVDANFGTGADLKITHNGTNTSLTNITGQLRIGGNDIRIQSQNHSEDYILCVDGGAVTLHHNDVAKIATTSDGVTITGSVKISDAGTIGSATTTDAIAIASNGIVTFKDDILIKNAGTIGSATTTDAITIASDGIVSFRNNIVFEGSSANEFETTISITDPTADRTWTLPDTTDTFVGKATTDTLTNKILENTELKGTISGTSIKDEDDMSSDSSSHLATQQSIKKYVDDTITGQDLDFQGDNGGALSIDLDSETLDIAGGTGIDTVGSSNTLTVAIDSTVATLTGNQTLTNKTLTSPVFNTEVSGTAVLDSDTMTGVSSTKLASSESIKAYVDAQVTAQDLDFQGDSGGALNIDLDSETLDIAGGTGIDTVGSSNTLTVAIDSTVATLTGSQTLTNKTLTTPTVNTGLLLKNAAISAGYADFYEDSDNGTNRVRLIGPAATADVTVTLPAATDTLVGKATTDTLTNKSLTSPAITGSISGNAFLDEDDLVSNSATKVASQQSIKAYVDNAAESRQDDIGAMISQVVAATAHETADEGTIYQILSVGSNPDASGGTNWTAMGAPTGYAKNTVFTSTDVAGVGPGTMTKAITDSTQTNISVQYDDVNNVLNFVTPSLLSGNITGNAATVTVNDVDNDTSCYVGLWEDDSGTLEGATDAGLTYNASTNKLTVTGDIEIGSTKSLIIGTASMSEGDLEKLDDITNGTAAASKALVLDTNKDIGTIRNLTINGVFTDGNYTFDTSGNVSGLGTISSGAITSSGTVTANAGVVVDNITIDGTEIDLSSGDLTIDVDGDIILDADGGEIVFKNDGTQIGYFSSGSSDFIMHSSVNDKDIIFKGVDNNNSITALTLDMSDAGAATFNSDVIVGGNLTVSGTTTEINSTTLTVDDKNIELGTVATPTDTTADGGGITLKGTTDKTILWTDSTDSWDFNQAVKSTNGFIGDLTGNADSADEVTRAVTHSTLGSGTAWHNTTGGNTPRTTSGITCGSSRSELKLYGNYVTIEAVNAGSGKIFQIGHDVLKYNGVTIVDSNQKIPSGILPEATTTAKGAIELFSNTDQSVAATAVSAVASRTYGLQLNSAGQGVVNVPWTDTNTHLTHTGEVTGSTSLTIADNKVDEANLKVSNGPTNGYFLSAQSGDDGGLTWAAPANTTYTAGQGLTLTSTVFSNDVDYTKVGGYNDIGLGPGALASRTTGNYNVAVGNNALSNLEDKDYNTAVGYLSQYLSDAGEWNTSIGAWALRYNTSGDNNTAVGAFAMDGSNIATLGSDNTAVGLGALGHTGFSGNQNVGIGSYGGSTITSGDNNIVIGYNAQAQVATDDNQINIGDRFKYAAGTAGPTTPYDFPGMQESLTISNSAGTVVKRLYGMYATS